MPPTLSANFCAACGDTAHLPPPPPLRPLPLLLLLPLSSKSAFMDTRCIWHCGSLVLSSFTCNVPDATYSAVCIHNKTTMTTSSHNRLGRASRTGRQTHPKLKLFEAGSRAGVEADDSGARGAVVQAGQALKLLRAGGVPDAQRDGPATLDMHLDAVDRLAADSMPCFPAAYVALVMCKHAAGAVWSCSQPHLLRCKRCADGVLWRVLSLTYLSRRHVFPTPEEPSSTTLQSTLACMHIALTCWATRLAVTWWPLDTTCSLFLDRAGLMHGVRTCIWSSGCAVYGACASFEGGGVCSYHDAPCTVTRALPARPQPVIRRGALIPAAERGLPQDAALPASVDATLLQSRL